MAVVAQAVVFQCAPAKSLLLLAHGAASAAADIVDGALSSTASQVLLAISASKMAL